MKKILTVLTSVMLINAVIFCCCATGLAFSAQEHSCCANHSATHSGEQCSLQNDQSSQHHSCECQAITSVLPSADFKTSNSLAWNKLFTNPWTHANPAEVFVRHPLQQLTFFDTSPDLFASLISFTKNPVLRI